MQAIRRPLAPIAVLAVIAALAASCTGGDARETPSDRPTEGTAAASAPTSVAPGTGVYVYQNAGLTATLDLDGGSGTLTIDNETGRELSPPSFYLLDARDGRRVDGVVQGATTTPNDRTATFDVTFSGLDVRNIGLAVLLVGHDNFGAFVRR
jgi:hypothetical protein